MTSTLISTVGVSAGISGSSRSTVGLYERQTRPTVMCVKQEKAI